MSKIPANCIEYNEKRKICIATEKGKTYTLNNISNCKARKVKVDKCLPQAKGEKRCDYLFNTDDEKLRRVIFIELKGSNLTIALKQLHTTIVYLKEDFKNYQIDERIVARRDTPGFKNLPDYFDLFKIIKPNNGTIIRATNNIYTETI